MSKEISLSVRVERWVYSSGKGLDSVKHAALICGYHVLDVDEGVFAAVGLEHLEGLLDQVSEDQ